MQYVNEMQQILCQILDLGLKYYLRILDLQFYFVWKRFDEID